MKNIKTNNKLNVLIASVFSIIFILSLTLLTTSAQATDTASGTISRIDVTDGTNLGFRVMLTGYPVLCSAGGNVAYLNETDSNYKVYVSTLLTAKTTGSNVVLYTENGSYGLCHIVYLMVN